MAYPAPRLIFWETTAACNLKCIHCRRVTLAEQLTPQDLTTQEAFRLIDQIAEVGKPVFVLSGGEPLFRPDIYEIARYATDKGIPVALATNGTMIDAEVAEKIKASGVKRVSISFDGSDAATHDKFRALDGSFESAKSGFRALRKVGLPVQINTTVAKHNQTQLEAMRSMAKEMDAVGLHLFLLVPVGCGVEIAAEQMISAQDYEQVLNWLYDVEQADSDLQLKATCAPHYFRVMRTRRAEDKRKGVYRELPASHDRQVHGQPHGQMHAATKGCLAGTGVCFVSHRGEIFPCGYLPVSAGNIRKKHFSEIWQNSPLFDNLRNPDKLEGKCGICQFKQLCSGCRARAYGMTGNYLAEEPFCAYEPSTREVVPIDAIR